jgi:hypothetical protein
MEMWFFKNLTTKGKGHEGKRKKLLTPLVFFVVRISVNSRRNEWHRY